jgi:hypothetical protein
MSTPGRASWRDLGAIAAGVGAVAVAVWLIPASVYIVRWTASGPTRVALFAPLARLAWIGAAAAIGLAGIVAWTRRDPHRRQHAAAVIGPFAVLWVWVVPFLPWLADRIPLLLVLAGPIRWSLVVVALAAALGVSNRLGAVLDALSRHVGRRTVFAVSLAAYLASGTLWARTIGIGGDEPHYLMIAQSLLADGDLLIENNHDNREYRTFFGSPLRPDFMVRGRDNQIYSIHAPGLSVLLLPAYAVGGFPASLVVICLIGALVALAVFDLSDAVAGRNAALFTWAAICFTVPFVPAGWLIYPDTVGALIVAWASLWIWKPVDARLSTSLWRGAALAALPWFHTKFVIFLAIFAAALAFQLRRHLRALVVMGAPIALSLAGWLWFFYVIYGVFDPQAPYGDYMLQLHAKNIPRSLLGLLFDQKFGLLVYSPVYLATIGGGWIMVRRGDLRYLGIVLLASSAAFFWGSARMYMWWGGSSAPARFLVPLIPCLAPMIAVAVADARFLWARPLFAVCAIVSIGVAFMAAILPESRLVYSDPHDYARLLMALQGGSPLAATFPTFTAPDWWTPFIGLLPWFAAGVLGLATVAFASRRIESEVRLKPDATSYSLWPGLAGALVFLLVAGVGTAGPGTPIRDEIAQRGALELLWRWDPDRVRAFEYDRNVPLDAAHLRDLSVVSWRGPAEPVALPAGAYEARVWFAGAGAREGEIVVTSQQSAVFGRFAGALQNPTSIPFELPSDAPSVVVKLRDPKLAERVVNTEIVPHDVSPLSARDGHTVRAVDSIVDSTNGYIVYVDSTTFPEGGVFWTRGTDLATVLVAPGGASRLVLTLFPGPLSGDVRVSVAGTASSVHVEANQIAQFDTDLPRGVRLVPVQIQAPAQFRPNDVDSNSDDTRRLGVQVRVGLK